VGAPAGHVQVRVVIALHQPARITLEIAPWYSFTKLVAVILAQVDSDRTSARSASWPVDHQELTVLVLAHGLSSRSVGIKGSARNVESSPRWKNR
jgi:hypothetical protein